MGKPSSLYDRREFLRLTSAGILAGLVSGCRISTTKKRPNILFIAVDDLRPELGCYGNREIQSPHFDSFAQEGMVFTRAYCQAAACAPSRASLMTGLRPDSTRVWSLGEEFRKTIPDVVTMPQYFHRFGYYTVSLGKIFHNHMPDRMSFDEPDLRPAEYMTPELIDRDPESFYYDEELKKELAEVREERIRKNPNAYAGGWAYGRSWEASDVPDNAFYDGAQTDLALETLARIKDKRKPFYMALGYYRPHLPFVAPKKYWDLYDRSGLLLATNPYLPENAPVMAADSSYELKACYDLTFVRHPSEYSLPEETARLLKHGYYASVSYVDACFGKLMSGLANLGLAENTIVIVWGDHGWKLGEHNGWCKQTNYNIDTRVPLIIRWPRSRLKGGRSDRLVELVDLHPTLCDLAGIDIPSGMEGASFKPLFSNPDREWKSAVFSQYHRRPNVSPDKQRYMGYSMVTERYHYVEWRHWDNDRKLAGEVAAVELYDNQADPDENRNIAGFPENAGIVAELAQKLRAGWRAARPS
jgi:iduronate 2-sulfatase